MIYGIGIDIVKINRFREAANRWGERFLERVFTEEEISYCLSRKDPYLSFAVRFAAKEALIKAIGAEVQASMQDIVVLSAENGRPSIKVRRRLKEFFEDKKISATHLSMSHEKDYGTAIVVLESFQ